MASFEDVEPAVLPEPAQVADHLYFGDEGDGLRLAGIAERGLKAMLNLAHGSHSSQWNVENPDSEVSHQLQYWPYFLVNAGP